MTDRISEGIHVGLADIARLAGVGPAAVSNWRRRHPGFPPPVGGTDRSPRFALADVQAWLETQGRAARMSPDEALWRVLDGARDEVEPADLVVAAGLAVLHDRGLDASL